MNHSDTPHTGRELPRFGELEAEFEILRELGRGGTAVVYLARERALSRTVALKVIRSTFVEDTEAVARLEREARTVAQLQHPNIVMLHGTRRLSDGSIALVMQYVAGHTLRRLLQAQGALPYERVVSILTDIGRALVHAHRHRIVHRDIKPENVYIDEETGIASLSDFGIARSWETEANLTLPGSAIGTPAYMSPEQIDGGDLDGRSDIYSLGLLGYEMVAGEAPWRGESLFSVIYKQKHEPLPPLSRRRIDVPDRLVHTLEGALRKKPDERWADAHAFLAALRGEASLPAAFLASDRAPGMSDDEGAGGRVEDESLTIQYVRADMDRPPAPPPATLPAPVPSADHTGPVPEPQVHVASAPLETSPRRRRAMPSLRVLAGAALVVIAAGAGVAAVLDQRGVGPAGAESVTAPAPAAPAPTAAADGTPGEAAYAFALYGGTQVAAAGDTLPEPLVVRVEDRNGRPVAGALVRFEVSAGAATLSPDTARTDATGTAQAIVVALATGELRVDAAVDGAASSASSFSARITARAPATLNATSPQTVRGTAGSSAVLRVRVLDDRGAPVPGVRVQFAGGAADTRVEARNGGMTDAQGFATAAWRLGQADQTVVASVAELPDATVTFQSSTAPASRPIRSGLVTGGTHTCALSTSGVVTCWGANDSGQLGAASARRAGGGSAAPEPIAVLAAGVGHSCGIAASGATYCWGSNTYGQLGDGTRSSREVPSRVAGDQRLVSIAAGNGFTCGLDADGALFCWGQNGAGQLADGSRTDRTQPVASGGSRRFRSIALGWAHGCGLDGSGQAFCWGRNGAGELGDGSSADRTEPVRVSGGHRFTSLAAGSAHTCGLKADGAILCWGRNSNGQLGAGTGDSSVPVAVETDEPFTSAAAGGVHTCGLTRDGAVFCWGRNTYGQLGDGSTEDRPRPVRVLGDRTFVALHAGGAHTCATAGTGQRYCWGYNVDGQLGDGTRQNRSYPVTGTR